MGTTYTRYLTTCMSLGDLALRSTYRLDLSREILPWDP